MRERPRFQFSLAMVFVVVLAASLLALLARLDHPVLATFLGGSVLGSVVARRFARTVVGGATGGAAAMWVYYLVYFLMPAPPDPPGTIDISRLSSWFVIISVELIMCGLIGGAIVGATVWFIRFLKENPPPKDEGRRR